MTKHYNYTFRYYGQQVTISKSVSDRMEERKMFKKTAALMWMTDTLREYTGDKYFRAAHSNELVEVSRKETVKLADTFKAMDDAKTYYFSLTREERIAQFGW